MQGRKPKPKDEKFVALIVRMTPADKAAIVADAEDAGMSASAFAAQAIKNRNKCDGY